MNRLTVGSFVLMLAVAFGELPSWGRDWKDATGQHTTVAELVTIKDNKVYLEKEGGKTISVSITKLSEEDQKYLQSLSEYQDYFDKHPIPGRQGENAGKRMARIHVETPDKAGEIRRFSDLGWGVDSLAFSPDGGLLAAGKTDRALMVFNVDKSTRTSFVEKLDSLGQVTCVAFTPDGKKLLAGGYHGRIQVFDVDSASTLKEANRFVGHSGAIHAIAISGDGKTVLSGGAEKKLRCWDLQSGREQFAVDGFQGDVKATYISRKGRQGLGCDGQTLVLVDMVKGEAIQSMKLASYTAQAVAIAPNGSRVVVGDTYALRMWDIKSGKEFPSLQDREIQWTARFLDNSKYVLSGGQGKVNLWDVAKQNKIYEFDTAGTYYVKTLACSPDNQHFAAIPGSSGQSLQVFQLPNDVAKE